MFRFTIFTPTYNRVTTLPRLYNSLIEQSFSDFEWIVIDDGSTDDTQLLFDNWKKVSPFPIVYLKKDNGGKHRAINQGLTIAKGELFFIVDSDDYLPAKSLEIIDNMEKTIPDKSRFCGLYGLRGFPDGKQIGSSFEGKILDIVNNEAGDYGITGDKAIVFYTKVFKNYKFVTFPGENFISEDTSFKMMGIDGYLIRFFNTVVYFCNYLDDGLSKNIATVFAKNPKGHGYYIWQKKYYSLVSKPTIRKEIIGYYLLHRKTMCLSEIADNLKMNKFYLFIYLLISRAINRFYSKKH